MPTALICGVSGQDGAYLARLLLQRGYTVWGTSRDAHAAAFPNLHTLGIRDDVRTRTMQPDDFRSVLTALDTTQPDEVYDLAGQTSVGLSFQLPVESLQSIALGTLNLLEALRFLDTPARLLHAGSSETFGDTADQPADEDHPLRPRSPYGVAKASARWLVTTYRDAYGLYAATGILSNHESPLRPTRFVTRKIATGVAEIARGARRSLSLGNLSVARDWGWAPEYVDAMWRILQRPQPTDYVIATGTTITLERFLEAAFAEVDLDWREHVTQSPALQRPSDLPTSRLDPSRAARELDWRATTSGPDVAAQLVRAELDR